MPQDLRDPSLMQYAVKLDHRHAQIPARHGLPDLAKYVTFGASPRATIGLIEGARCDGDAARPRLRGCLKT
jgi:hypothetical protein